MIHFTGFLLSFLQDMNYVYSFTGSLPCSLWWLSDLGQGQFHHRLFHRVHHPSQSSDWHPSRPGGKDRRAQIWEESIYIQGSSGMINLKVFPKQRPYTLVNCCSTCMSNLPVCTVSTHFLTPYLFYDQGIK